MFTLLKALSHASSKGHLKCVHKLLKLGADPSIYTYDYLYPFDLAQNSGFTEVTGCGMFNLNR